jgi:hypothetical protein
MLQLRGTLLRILIRRDFMTLARTVRERKKKKNDKNTETHIGRSVKVCELLRGTRVSRSLLRVYAAGV